MGFFNGDDYFADLIARFIVQLLLIVFLSRFLHFFLSRIFREPMVIAELIAGILLGPSAFGQIDGFTEHIFPPSSLPPLKLMANTGLLFFMLLVGMELDATIFKRNVVRSMVISICGIAFPFAGGICVALWMYDYQGSGQNMGIFLAYIGVAMSITAFPVLARILADRNLTVTRIGVLALSAAAFDDVVAWCLLALVVSIVNSSNYLTALWTILTGIGWTLFMFLIFRPITGYIFNRYKLHNKITPLMVAVLMCGMFISAWMTYEIGIHEIFGAFLFGLCLPRAHHFTHNFTKRIEDLIIVFFVPLYFTNSGLNVDITKMKEGTMWAIAFTVTAVAVAGKVLGCFVPTYFLTKLNFKESLSVGFLMSTKGLVELIVLNIGYNLKVLNQVEFTIMVIMALITTFLTSPIVALIYPKRLMLLRERANFKKGNEFSLLLCISNRSEAMRLISIAKTWIALNKKNAVQALRLVEVDDRPSTYFNWGGNASEEESDFDDIDMNSEKSSSESPSDSSTSAKARKWIKKKVEGRKKEGEKETTTEKWLNRLTCGWYVRAVGSDPEEDTVVSSIKEGAKLCRMRVTVVRKVSSNIKQDICNVSLTRRADMTIIGDGEMRRGKSESKLENLLTAPVVGYVLGHAKETNVGVYVTAPKARKNLAVIPSDDEARRALVVYYGNDKDYIVIKLARQMAKESKHVGVTILYVKERKAEEGTESDDDDTQYETDVAPSAYDTASDTEDEEEEKKDKKKKKKTKEGKKKKKRDIEEGGVVEQEEANDTETENTTNTQTHNQTNDTAGGSVIKGTVLTTEEKQERKWIRKDMLLKQCLKKRKRRAIEIVTRRMGESVEEAIERVVAEAKESDIEEGTGSDLEEEENKTEEEKKNKKAKGPFGMLVIGIGTKLNNAHEVEWLLDNPQTPAMLLVRQAKSKLDKDFYDDNDDMKRNLLEQNGGEEANATEMEDKKKKRKGILGRSIKPKAVVNRGAESTKKFFQKYVNVGRD